jgi:hypothetical protein
MHSYQSESLINYLSNINTFIPSIRSLCINERKIESHSTCMYICFRCSSFIILDMERTKWQQVDTVQYYNLDKKQKLQDESNILCLYLINLIFIFFSNDNQYKQVSYLKSIN